MRTDFFEKNIDNENLKDLLPQTILSGYDLRPICKYHNYVCRTERFKNSFLPQSRVLARILDLGRVSNDQGVFLMTRVCTCQLP